VAALNIEAGELPEQVGFAFSLGANNPRARIAFFYRKREWLLIFFGYDVVSRKPVGCAFKCKF
jgi:hypothetical protein